jgi:hypothetical protein
MWEIINQNIISILIGAAVVLLIWLFLLTFFLIKTIIHYRKLIGSSKKKDLKKLLEEILGKIEEQKKKADKLKEEQKDLKNKNLKNLQKVGFLRFNPFSDTGGDQSFVLSILDGEENGIVLSSLHSRGITRIYAKEVKKGKEAASFKLSKEEKEAIKKALKKRR